MRPMNRKATIGVETASIWTAAISQGPLRVYRAVSGSGAPPVDIPGGSLAAAGFFRAAGAGGGGGGTGAAACADAAGRCSVSIFAASAATWSDSRLISACWAATSAAVDCAVAATCRRKAWKSFRPTASSGVSAGAPPGAALDVNDGRAGKAATPGIPEQRRGRPEQRQPGRRRLLGPNACASAPARAGRRFGRARYRTDGPPQLLT